MNDDAAYATAESATDNLEPYAPHGALRWSDMDPYAPITHVQFLRPLADPPVIGVRDRFGPAAGPRPEGAGTLALGEALPAKGLRQVLVSPRRNAFHVGRLHH